MAGKIIVITGANGGLGRALSARFASEGETVVMLGRSLEKVQEVAREIGENTVAIACDVTSPHSVTSAFAEIAKLYPKIDVLINNAAIFSPFLIEEASDDQIMQGILTNLAGPILCSRSAIPMLNRGGQIINISSESVEVPMPHLLIYQATKAGLERFAHGLHSEVEEQGIRVSVVRAGQMIGPGSSAQMEPVAMTRFFEACTKRGINLMTRGMSQYQSTTQIFRTLIDLPPDVHIQTVNYQGRVPD